MRWTPFAAKLARPHGSSRFLHVWSATFSRFPPPHAARLPGTSTRRSAQPRRARPLRVPLQTPTPRSARPGCGGTYRCTRMPPPTRPRAAMHGRFRLAARRSCKNYSARSGPRARAISFSQAHGAGGSPRRDRSTKRGTGPANAPERKDGSSTTTGVGLKIRSSAVRTSASSDSTTARRRSHRAVPSTSSPSSARRNSARTSVFRTPSRLRGRPARRTGTSR